jgi:hypothetical protein
MKNNELLHHIEGIKPQKVVKDGKQDFYNARDTAY